MVDHTVQNLAGWSELLERYPGSALIGGPTAYHSLYALSVHLMNDVI